MTTLSRRRHLIRDFSDAFQLFSLLGRLQTHDEKFDELLQPAIEILIRGIHKLSIPHAIAMLITCEKRNLIFGDLFDAVAKRMIQEQWDMWQISSILSIFIGVKYINVEYLEKIGDMIVKNKDVVADDPRISIFNFVEMFSMANCLPTNAERVFDALCSCDKKIQELKVNSPIMLLAMVCNLVSLQYYPMSLIQIVTSPESLLEVSNEFIKPGTYSVILNCVLPDR